MSYKDCKFVNTWGFIDLCYFKPVKPYEAYYNMKTYPPLDELIQTTNMGIIKRPTIFCHPYALRDLIPLVLNNVINFEFILITNHFDTDMPTGLLNNNILDLFLSNKCLVRWYVQNAVIKHPKITSIPIGMDYHTIANSSNHSWGPHQTPLEQENTLIELRTNMKTWTNRILKIYTTCNLFFGSGHGQDRRDALEQVPKDLLDKEDQRIPRIDTWKKQMEYVFVLSPHGNGLDCHRTWEALLLGCIPIVKTSPIDNIFKDLPVLIVESWSDVNLKLLENTIIKFQKGGYENTHPTHINDKLKMRYWIDKINNCEHVE